MHPLPDEKHSGENKQSGLLSLPATLLRKFYTNSEAGNDSKNKLQNKEKDFSTVEDEIEHSQSNEITALSKALVKLVSKVENIFENQKDFEKVKNIASEVSDHSQFNHALYKFTEVLAGVCEKYVIEENENLFPLLGEILDKFNFPQYYLEDSLKLKGKCKKIKNINEFKSLALEIYEEFSKIYNDLENEKKELESFLFKVGKKINSIGDDLHKGMESQISDLKTHNDINLKMDNAISNINEKLLIENDVKSLKNIIKEQLDSLQNLVEEEKKLVKEQEHYINANVKDLVHKVNKLKIETFELKGKIKQEKEQALLDPLTTIYNRQAFDNRIKNIISKGKPHKSDIALLVWDIDHFKLFNDKYGHIVGDKVLKSVALTLNKQQADNSFLARYGGEEFVMILSNTEINEAKELANDLRKEISNTVFLHKGMQVKVTVSCGLAMLQELDTSEKIFERADKALYEAKQNGRNQVHAYS